MSLQQAVECVSRGDVTALRNINVTSFINELNENCSLLYTACNGGHVKIVKLLLSVSGIDVNKGVSTVSIY